MRTTPGTDILVLPRETILPQARRLHHVIVHRNDPAEDVHALISCSYPLSRIERQVEEPDSVAAEDLVLHFRGKVAN
jgi:hypothetical protein